MNSDEFYSAILSKRPRYAKMHEDLIGKIANKGFTKSDITQFGPIYELFMYSFVIGYHLGSRIPLPSEKKDFLQISQWNPRSVVNSMIICLINDKRVTKLNFVEIDNLEENKIKEFINNLITALEEYAHCGLNFLEDKWENNKNEFDDPFVYANILKDVIENKKNHQ